jgi:hypothetical protein
MYLTHAALARKQLALRVSSSFANRVTCASKENTPVVPEHVVY